MWGVKIGSGGEVQVCCNVFESSVMIESSWEHAFCHSSDVR